MLFLAWAVWFLSAEKSDQLKDQTDMDATFVNVRFVKPLDTRLLEALQNHSLLVTVEENVKDGGFGEHVSAYMEEQDLHPGVEFHWQCRIALFRTERGSQRENV